MRIASTLLIFMLAGHVMAYDQPAFDLIERENRFEIRHYQSYLVAQTTVDGDYDASGDAAFNVLAGYIFGDNGDSKKMKMTVPVIRKPEPDSTGTSYQFVMEPQFTLTTLPVPNSKEIRLLSIPSRLVAVMRYSGRANKRNYEKALQELLEALEGKTWQVVSTPESAVYNGPLTLPFFRRNEVMLEVKQSD